MAMAYILTEVEAFINFHYQTGTCCGMPMTMTMLTSTNELKHWKELQRN